MDVYLQAKFEVSSIILTGFRQGGNFTPHSTSKRTPKNSIQNRVKLLLYILLMVHEADDFSILARHGILKIFFNIFQCMYHNKPQISIKSQRKKILTNIINVKKCLVNRNVFFAAFFAVQFANKYSSFRKIIVNFFCNSQRTFLSSIALKYFIYS